LFHEYLGNLSCSQGQYERAIGHYTTALDIFREIGVRHAEGTTLGNLGDTLFKLLRLDEAEAAFRQAIGLCDEKYPLASGAYRGSLALLLAQQAQPEEAQTLLDVGERQVTVEPIEHAKFLCKKGQIQLISNQLNAAQESLTQAEAIAAKLNVNEHSQIAQAIADLAALLDGESPDDSAPAPAEGSEPSDEGELALIEANRLLEKDRKH
jgi:tetratricopeptide (TPR) repeat protein